MNHWIGSHQAYLILQLQFHPTNPRLLFATCRNRRDILTWDIRNTSQLYSSLSLGPSSNQRRRFDINSAGSHLVVGDGVGYFGQTIKCAD